MEHDSNMLQQKKKHIFSEALRISIKYIAVILGINIIQFLLNELNIYFNGQSAISVIITYGLMIISPWGSLTLIYIVYKELKNEIVGLKEIIINVFSQFKLWALTNIIQLLIILGLSFLLAIPGLVQAFYYSFIWQVFIFEKLKHKSALDQSKKFVKERFKDISVFMFSFIGFMIINIAISITMGIYGTRIDNYILQLLYTLCSSSISCYFLVLLTIVYLEYKGNLIYQQEEKKFKLSVEIQV